MKLFGVQVCRRLGLPKTQQIAVGKEWTALISQPGDESCYELEVVFSGEAGCNVRVRVGAQGSTFATATRAVELEIEAAVRGEIDRRSTQLKKMRASLSNQRA